MHRGDTQVSGYSSPKCALGRRGEKRRKGRREEVDLSGNLSLAPRKQTSAATNGGVIPRRATWRRTVAVSNDRRSSLLVFNYHLGRIKDNPVGVVGDIVKARATTYGRRANSRLRSIYYPAWGVPSERGDPHEDRGGSLNISSR